MQIETYEQPEIASAIADEDREEFRRITESLGLLKQQAFIGDSQLNPFRKMTVEEMRVYDTLLPERTDLEQFDHEAIPLRVLRLIQLCKLNRWFQKLQIMHSPVDPDPVLVAQPENSYNSPRFLLARWGNELENFETLRRRAIEKHTEKTRNDRQKALASVEQDAKAYMYGVGW